jgi:type VI secretion system protein ImpM
MVSDASPGFFGKVPAVGDFVSRRLPRSFLDPWDQWMQSALASSRQRLSENWLDNYLGSPIWRFALSAKVAGPLPCSGVMIPSVDKAGRYFPFTLVTFLPARVNIFELAAHSQSWYEAAEAVALSVLEDTPPDMESLDQQVVALGLLTDGPSEEADTVISESRRAMSKPWHFPLQSVTGLVDIFPEMVRQLTELRFGSYSLWWSEGSEHIEPASLMCEGLPPPSGYAAMLAGGWDEYGWDEVPALSESINAG